MAALSTLAEARAFGTCRRCCFAALCLMVWGLSVLSSCLAAAEVAYFITICTLYTYTPMYVPAVEQLKESADTLWDLEREVYELEALALEVRSCVVCMSV